MSYRILIVEDEDDLLDLLEFTLSKEGYEVFAKRDVKNVRDILDKNEIDLILMDRNLPSKEGSFFIKELREEGYLEPVIYISAKDREDDILEGFERGGDDYITKPFNLNELKARVKAVIKRSKKEAQIIKYKDIVYNSSTKSFTVSGRKLNLTPLERDLLLEFIKNRNVLLSRDYLLERVWRDSGDMQYKTVTVGVKRLKDKLDPKGEKGYIKSVRGEGYIFC